MGLGPVVTIASSLTSFGFKTLTRPKHLLYDMFVCRTDSVVFMLICRGPSIFLGFQNFQATTTEDTAHAGVCRTIWKKQCCKLLQVS
jgi:hypothetical protein